MYLVQQRGFVANHRESDYLHVVLLRLPYYSLLGVRESIVQAGSDPIGPLFVLVLVYVYGIVFWQIA